MARYTVTQAAFLAGRLLSAGDTVDVSDDTVPGPHMEPARDDKGREDKAARAAKDAAGKSSVMPVPGDPRYIGDLIAHNIRDGRTDGRVEAASAPSLVVDSNGLVRGVRQDADPVDEKAKNEDGVEKADR